ncbi:MAG TPA: toll/interleukin-1 receptor domain-containing protein [Bacilli bacterium]|nr:toll/interleukin-1 receptor domain-containing protein [Bacilli bacterium]
MGNKPPIYFDYKESTSDEKFVFISYSHRNKNEVYTDLHKLYNMGVNYWYDANLTPGDKWNEICKQVILDDICVGVIFFLSEDSLQSDAVYQEMLVAREKSSPGKPFLILTVNFNGYSVFKLVINMLNKLDKSQYDVFHNRLIDILQIFPSNQIYIPRVETSDYIEKIVNKLKDFNPKLVSNKTSYLQYLTNLTSQFYKYNEFYFLKDFGTYVRNTIVNNLGILFKEGYQEIRNEKYIGLNRQYFSFEPLDWILVDYQDDYLILSTIDIIDFKRYSEIDRFLYEIKTLLFSKEDLVILSPTVGIIEQKHLDIFKQAITNLQCTKYVQAKSKNQYIGFWVKENESYKILSNQFVDIKINNIVNFSAGIILIVKIDAKKLISKFGGSK